MKKKIIYLAIAICLVGSIILLVATYLKKNIKVESFLNKTYSLAYDSQWQVKTSNDNYILLEHDKLSTVEIKLSKLTENQETENINQLVGDVKYQIEQDNPKYKLIITNEKKLAKNKTDGYQLVYETNDSQVLIEVTKQNGYLIVFSYLADNTYFDILLDSFQYIEDSFEMLNKDYALANEDITTTGIKFSAGDETYDKTSDYLIADNHYEVTYQLPNECQLNSFDTTRGYFNCGDKVITVNNVYQNLYNYIVDDSLYGSVAQEIKYLQEDKEYKDVVVENEVTDSGYRYRITYKGANNDTKYEKIYLLEDLDYLRTWVVEIESQNESVPKEFIDQIKIKDTLKYGENISKELTDGYLTGELKTFVNSYETEKSFYQITYQVPSKYEERDYLANKNEWRYFQYGYDENTEDYQYDITMELSKYGDSEVAIANLNSDYQDAGNTTLTKQINVGQNNEFLYYTGQYTENNKTYYAAYLYLDLAKGGVLKINIISKINLIPQEIVNDFTKISVKIEVYSGGGK